MTTTTFFTPVQQDIQEVEALMQAQADAEQHPDLRAALQHLLSAGGKRVRPTLGLLAGNMLGGNHDTLVRMAAAVELLHTATLVHDDLIDGALLRRGIPTLNARWSSAATVLTGDFIFARAARLAAETNSLPLIKQFAETLAIIVNGELNQLFGVRGVVDRENYYRRIYAKTASLFEMCAYAAAELSSKDERVHWALKTFGYETGMAFQIMDDVLDFTGEQATVGKPVGSDLLQGLVTLPALYFAEANPGDPDVRSLPEGGWTEPERMARLVTAIRQSDAIERATEEARQAIDRAVRALDPFPASTEREALLGLARYIVDRRL